MVGSSLDLVLCCRAYAVPQVYVCPPDACYLNGVECVGHEYWKKGVASCVDPKAEGGLCRGYTWERGTRHPETGTPLPRYDVHRGGCYAMEH